MIGPGTSGYARMKRLPFGSVSFEIKIRIRPAGGVDDICRPATAEDRETYSEEWTAALAGKDMPGTRLDEWPALAKDPTKIDALKAAGFFRVEQIAEAADNMIQGAIAEPYKTRREAQEWLATGKPKDPDPAAAGMAEVLKVMREQAAEIATLRAQVNGGAGRPAGEK